PVAPLFDEIVVIDTGSRDATKQVAARFTSQVFDFPWCDDFSAARNESLRRASGDWAFWLDADDRLAPDECRRLGELFALLTDRPAAYLMETHCTPRYECESACVISHVRLFRRHPDVRFRGRVHEQVAPSLTALGYELLSSDVKVQHTGYCDAATHQRKLHRDLRLLRMDYAIDPDDSSTLVHLGMTCLHLGKLDEAQRYLQRVVSSGQRPHDYLRQVYAALAKISLHAGRPAEALATIDQALRMLPDAEYLLLLRADCLYELDRYDEAHQTLLQIIRSGQQWHYRGGVPAEIKEKLAPRRLADVLRLKGRHELAEAQLRALLERFPDDTLSWYLLGRVYTEGTNWPRVEIIAERLLACPQGEAFGAILLAVRYLANCQFSKAEALVDRAVACAPQLPLARVMRLELLLRIGAPAAAQMQACHDLLRLQPGNADARQLLNRLEEISARQVRLGPAMTTPPVAASGVASSLV
ncbi:MAG: tetratricopeptide repeat protein, partial [Pirellulales bacterium]|nr:tetratricopeptide repeat protein [Pirellulales bacterium]